MALYQYENRMQALMLSEDELLVVFKYTPQMVSINLKHPIHFKMNKRIILQDRISSFLTMQQKSVNSKK